MVPGIRSLHHSRERLASNRNHSTLVLGFKGTRFLMAVGVRITTEMSFGVSRAKAKPEERRLAIGHCTCFQLAGPAVGVSRVFLNEALDLWSSFKFAAYTDQGRCNGRTV